VPILRALPICQKSSSHEGPQPAAITAMQPNDLPAAQVRRERGAQGGLLCVPVSGRRGVGQAGADAHAAGGPDGQG